MVATWSVGSACDVDELARKLCESPFDVSVLVLSSAVAEDVAIYTFLKHLASDEGCVQACKADICMRADVLTEKSVLCLGAGLGGVRSRVFVALHKVTIRVAYYAEKYIRSSGDTGVRFGSLTLVLDKTRQRM